MPLNLKELNTKKIVDTLISRIGGNDNNHFETTILLSAFTRWVEKNKDKKLSIGNFADIIRTNKLTPNKAMQECFNYIQEELDAFGNFITEAKENQYNSEINDLK